MHTAQVPEPHPARGADDDDVDAVRHAVTPAANAAPADDAAADGAAAATSARAASARRSAPAGDRRPPAASS